MFVCLLAARNCADDLPGYFESVARFADAVVALDDGSTDDTRAVLEAHPLVTRVLANPRRADYRGWDDSANRNQLLAAAAELAPDWVISLDADERIDATDAVALRAFVIGGAARDAAYLLRVFRMIDGLEHYDDASLWVGRLFPYEPGQSFPIERLHFVPLPTSIPRDRWRRTTFRIQHLASATDARRRERFAKYEEADPDRELQPDYSHLLAPPGRVTRWWPRPPDLPALANTAFRGPDPPTDTPDMAVIVAGLGGHGRIEAVEAIGSRYVMFGGDADPLAPASLAASIAAHERGWAMVGATVLNSTRRASAWAAHFLEHSAVLPNAPARELQHPPLRCSYSRSALLGLGDVGDDLAAVNAELFNRGYGAFHEPAFVMVEPNAARNPVQLVRHQFARGRRVARRRLDDPAARGWRRVRRVLGLALLVVPRRLARVTVEVARWGGSTRGWFVLAFPLVVVGVLSEWVGACVEIPRRASHQSDGDSRSARS